MAGGLVVEEVGVILWSRGSEWWWELSVNGEVAGIGVATEAKTAAQETGMLIAGAFGCSLHEASAEEREQRSHEEGVAWRTAQEEEARRKALGLVKPRNERDLVDVMQEIEDREGHGLL